MRLRAGRADAANLRVLVFPKGRGGEKIAGEIKLLVHPSMSAGREQWCRPEIRIP
jgi:hypothetical protein